MSRTIDSGMLPRDHPTSPALIPLLIIMGIVGIGSALWYYQPRGDGPSIVMRSELLDADLSGARPGGENATERLLGLVQAAGLACATDSLEVMRPDPATIKRLHQAAGDRGLMWQPRGPSVWLASGPADQVIVVANGGAALICRATAISTG